MAKIFFSICSAHQVPDEDCPICKVGFWADEEDCCKEDKKRLLQRR